jgi:hypothetical protein
MYRVVTMQFADSIISSCHDTGQRDVVHTFKPKKQRVQYLLDKSLDGPRTGLDTVVGIVI